MAIADVLRIDDLSIVGLNSYEPAHILCRCLQCVSFGAGFARSGPSPLRSLFAAISRAAAGRPGLDSRDQTRRLSDLGACHGRAVRLITRNGPRLVSRSRRSRPFQSSPAWSMARRSSVTTMGSRCSVSSAFTTATGGHPLRGSYRLNKLIRRLGSG